MWLPLFAGLKLLRDALHELALVDGLGEEVVHARQQTLRLVLRGDVGGDGEWRFSKKEDPNRVRGDKMLPMVPPGSSGGSPRGLPGVGE